MPTSLIPIQTFLGKYYPELHYASLQEKYKNTRLNKFFDQRFYIQNNKSQMIVDPALTGLTATFAGNEIHISKQLYDHPNVNVLNSLEHNDQLRNPKSLYDSEIFSTVAYLICQNHTTFQIVGEVDEPIYIKYLADYETFYSSVTVFDIAQNISVEIVEEIESYSALNSVINYVLQPHSELKLKTLYQNHLSGTSFVYRNIITQEHACIDHLVLGKGSSCIIDENKLHTYRGSKSKFYGIINSSKLNFSSVLFVHPYSTDYSVNIDYRNIIYGNGKVSFYPVIVGQVATEDSSVSVTDIGIDDLGRKNIEEEVKKFLTDLIDHAILERIQGSARFYNYKSKFLHFL